MIPRSSQFQRDVEQILDAQAVGLRWRDNIAPTVEFRYLASRAPTDVRTDLTQRPLSVMVLSAVNRATGAIESGCRITWSWVRGSVRVVAIHVSDTTAEYDVTLGLVR